MNHKRGRPKNRRAGCLMCKPHKINGNGERERREREAWDHEMVALAEEALVAGNEAFALYEKEMMK